MADARVLAVEPVFDGRVIKVRVERVCLPNGNEAEIEVVRHVGAAAIVPLLAEGEVLLVRQYRHAIGDWLLEVPAGKLDLGESPEACARREVEEETGFRAGELRPLGWIWTTPGFSDEKIWLYLATGLTTARQALQADEALSVERLALSEAARRASDGEIVDGKSVCALLRAASALGAR